MKRPRLQMLPLLLPVILAIQTDAIAQSVSSDDCRSLASAPLADTTISITEFVAAGEFRPPIPDAIPTELPYEELPAFCRVAASVSPVPESEIRFEVWLPIENWNGRFLATGNGGYSGAIWYWSMGEPLTRGFAVANTNTGHDGNLGDMSFAFRNRESLIDFAERAVHEMALKSKSLVAEFYGSPAEYSYWQGCSTGGRQGLVEAQRFPDDFDGIVAIAPAISQSRINMHYVWAVNALLEEPESSLGPEHLTSLHQAVVQQCDVLDGIVDGVIDNPRACSFDPGDLVCGGGNDSVCLTAQQAEAARKIYEGPANPRTGEAIAFGLEYGSELGWDTYAGGGGQELSASYFRNVVFEDREWNLQSFDFDSDVRLTTEVDDGLLAATNADVSAFSERNGKLMLIHGWNDQFISPRFSIEYYEDVVETMGGFEPTDQFMRVFLAPGMAHCDGGSGPNRFDALPLIRSWVEDGVAPDEILATVEIDSGDERSRPLCPYPRVARYQGEGSTDDAGSFVCTNPE